MANTKKLIIKIKCTVNDIEEIPDMEEFLGFVEDEIKTTLEAEDISITEFDLIENT